MLCKNFSWQQFALKLGQTVRQIRQKSASGAPGDHVSEFDDEN